jgi:hypothetical protein
MTQDQITQAVPDTTDETVFTNQDSLVQPVYDRCNRTVLTNVNLRLPYVDVVLKDKENPVFHCFRLNTGLINSVHEDREPPEKFLKTDSNPSVVMTEYVFNESNILEILELELVEGILAPTVYRGTQEVDPTSELFGATRPTYPKKDEDTFDLSLLVQITVDQSTGVLSSYVDHFEIDSNRWTVAEDRYQNIQPIQVRIEFIAKR